MHRVLELAVFPCRLLVESTLPPPERAALRGEEQAGRPPELAEWMELVVPPVRPRVGRPAFGGTSGGGGLATAPRAGVRIFSRQIVDVPLKNRTVSA
jgi:hypothetical protein